MAVPKKNRYQKGNWQGEDPDVIDPSKVDDQETIDPSKVDDQDDEAPTKTAADGSRTITADDLDESGDIKDITPPVSSVSPTGSSTPVIGTPAASTTGTGSSVDDEITGVQYLPYQDLPDVSTMPKRSDYNTHMNMMGPWLLSNEELKREYGKEETARRTKQSARVQSILRLGQAFHALANLSGTSQGAAYQEMPKVNDYPLATWKKERDAQLGAQVERKMKASQADYQEWLAAQQAWQKRYDAIKEYNEKALMQNTKAVNDWNAARQKQQDALNTLGKKHEYTTEETTQKGEESRKTKSTMSGGSATSSGSGSKTKDPTEKYRERIRKGLRDIDQPSVSYLSPEECAIIAQKMDEGANQSQVRAWIKNRTFKPKTSSTSSSSGSTAKPAAKPAAKPKPSAPYLKK